MSIKIFQDNIFPRHVSDLMNLMHMVVFNGTDGEENWDTYLTLKQKECVALGLAEYYQCEHCISHHLTAAHRLDKIEKKTITKNINSIILFLRIDTRTITKAEKEHWIVAWNKFANKMSIVSGDIATPHLIGLAIGIARDDDFLIELCGEEVIKILKSLNIEPRAAIGELESIVIFMKAAASKNRVADKLGSLFDSANSEPLSVNQ
ncbi:MAG: carboxymuconolactone decarboxylase family protein [Arenicellales bacterium]